MARDQQAPGCPAANTQPASEVGQWCPNRDTTAMRNPTATRPLFDTTPIGEAFVDQLRKAAAEIGALPADELLGLAPDEPAAGLLAKYLMQPPELDWGAALPEVREVWIDVPGKGRGVGTEVIEYILFTGSEGLFNMRPTGNLSDPPAGCVNAPYLLISHVGSESDPAVFRASLERERTAIRAYASRLAADVATLNADLENQIRAQLEARITAAQARRDLAAGLGIAAGQGPPPRPARRSFDERRPLPVAESRSSPEGPIGRGRPAWTRELFEKHWHEAWEATSVPRTYEKLAHHFRALDLTVGGLGAGQLGRLYRQFHDGHR